jgi:DNA-binding MarR family transcriptional regulator
MNKFRKVYIGRTPDGKTLCDTDPKVLHQAQAEILSFLPLEEYQKIGHHSVEITVDTGIPKIALTEQAKKAVRKKFIHRRFEEIDKQRVRPLASVAIEDAVDDKDYLNRLNTEAELLRDELRSL